VSEKVTTREAIASKNVDIPESKKTNVWTDFEYPNSAKFTIPLNSAKLAFVGHD
jgi:hypothetical protein